MEEYKILAMDLLHLSHRLGGPSYTEDDVNRLAKGIARHAWLDRQLAEVWCHVPAFNNPSLREDKNHEQ